MTEFIKLIAEATWKETDKTIGRVTLGENIEVGMEADELVTKVVGRFRIPVLPDVAFTYTSRERFSLTVPGSEPPLQTSFREDLDVGRGHSAWPSLSASLARFSAASSFSRPIRSRKAEFRMSSASARDSQARGRRRS